MKTKTLTAATWQQKLANYWNDVKYRFRNGGEDDHLEWDETSIRLVKCGRIIASIDWEDISLATFWQVNTIVFELDAVRLSDAQGNGITFDDLTPPFWAFADVVDQRFPGYKKALNDFAAGAVQAFLGNQTAPIVELRLQPGVQVEVMNAPPS